MHSFYKNKKPGKQRVFRKKKDAKKGSGGVGGPRRRKTYIPPHTPCVPPPKPPNTPHMPLLDHFNILEMFEEGHALRRVMRKKHGLLAFGN
jgi:hypothetical protein